MKSFSKMRPFIKVTEIWVPSADRSCLVFADGFYGPFSDFRDISKDFTFKFDEGLPGKAWASRQPIILHELQNSYFRRAEAATAAGLSCGVALPIFSGDDIKAVVVFFCGSDDDQVGGIELWRHDRLDSGQIALVDSHYGGGADTFEWSAQHITFGLGVGLPGIVWQTGQPLIIENLFSPGRFLRWKDSRRMGINVGLGIPCPYKPDQSWVMIFLSALGTPIATRFEVWESDGTGHGLRFVSGMCHNVPEFAAEYAGKTLPVDSGCIGTSYKTAAPALATDFVDEPEWLQQAVNTAELSTVLALPVLEIDGAVRSIVVWYS